MAKDLKASLRHKLDQISPEYGLVELSYPSFTRCYGYLSSPLSASDSVEALVALLDVAGGVRIEVEIEGARNGGEWFGSGKVWEARGRDEDRENVPPGGILARSRPKNTTGKDGSQADGNEGSEELAWGVKNFWTAFDALNDIVHLRHALSLAMSIHRAIIRQGSSIIDKQDIRTLRGHRVVVLSQGPDLALFCHPGILARLAHWLADAMRDKIPDKPLPNGKRRKNLPIVVACLNEHTDRYVVVGLTAAMDFGEVRKNPFTNTFLEAAEASGHTEVMNVTFDSSVLEIEKDKIKIFLESLCEAGLR